MEKILMLDKKMQNLINDCLPTDEVIYELADFFTAFSDVTRLKMISALCISEMCVTDLSKMLGINQTTISHQLRLLKNLNLVKIRRQGKIIFYSLCDEVIGEVLLKGLEFLGL